MTNEAQLPDRCCGRCKHGIAAELFDDLIVCAAPVALPVLPKCWVVYRVATEPNDGRDCPAFEAKEWRP